MPYRTQDATNPLMRTRMKGAIVKVLQKAKPPQGGRVVRFRPRGGYVSLAQTGLRKMFKTESWRFEPRLDVAAPAPHSAEVDPVRLVALAVNSLGPASYRAAVFGKTIRVDVDDEATAEVFRAAIALSCKDRPTNHLIEVNVRAS